MLVKLKIRRNEMLAEVNDILKHSSWVKCPNQISVIVSKLNDLEERLKNIDNLILCYHADKKTLKNSIKNAEA